MAKILSLWLKAGSEFPVIDPSDGRRIDANTPVKVPLSAWVRKQYAAKVLVDSDDEDQIASNAAAIEAYDAEAQASAVTQAAEQAALAAEAEAIKQAAVDAVKRRRAEEATSASDALEAAGITASKSVKLTPAKA